MTTVEKKFSDYISRNSDQAKQNYTLFTLYENPRADAFPMRVQKEDLKDFLEKCKKKKLGFYAGSEHILNPQDGQPNSVLLVWMYKKPMYPSVVSHPSRASDRHLVPLPTPIPEKIPA